MQIYKLQEANEHNVKSIKLNSNDNTIIVEKLNKEQSIIESLNIELPNFISDRLIEANTFNAKSGVANINYVFDDSIANILNATNTNIVELKNQNGKLVFINDKGKVVDINKLKAQYQQSEQNKQTQANIDAVTPKITNEDLNVFIQTIINNVNADKKFTNLGNGITFQVSFTGKTSGLKESAIKQFNEGNKKPIETNEIKTQNAAFTLNIALNGLNNNKKNIDSFELIKAVRDKICKKFNGQLFKDASGNTVKLNLKGIKLDGNEVTFEINEIRQNNVQNQQTNQSTQTKPTRLDKKMQKAQIRNLNAQTKLLKKAGRNYNGYRGNLINGLQTHNQATGAKYTGRA